MSHSTSPPLLQPNTHKTHFQRGSIRKDASFGLYTLLVFFGGAAQVLHFSVESLKGELGCLELKHPFLGSLRPEFHHCLVEEL
jgi:hypothetical protein